MYIILENSRLFELRENSWHFEHFSILAYPQHWKITQNYGNIFINIVIAVTPSCRKVKDKFFVDHIKNAQFNPPAPSQRICQISVDNLFSISFPIPENATFLGPPHKSRRIFK